MSEFSNENEIPSRDVLFQFWRDRSKEASLKEMVFETDAEELCPVEGKEILSLMCDVKGKDVLELGSGIGRFTGIIAAEANHVSCIDFMESFVMKNKETNGHMENITFLTADVTKQEFEPDSFDVVFSNWILQYLTDDEVSKLLVNIIKWVRPGGRVFFRESCFKMRGKGVFVDSANPTSYRRPSVYCSMFQQAEAGDPPKGLELVFSRNLKSYIELKKTYHQCCWMLQKTTRRSHGKFQQDSDTNDILRLERIHGTGFISIGGKSYTEGLVAMLDLKPGQRVLVVGSGTGGGSFYMAQKYDVEVFGIDFSINMVEIAMERTPAGTMIQFQICDPTNIELDHTSFDVVFSKDAMPTVAEKLATYKNFVNWLKPGGKLLVSDYCQSNGEKCEKFEAYLSKCSHTLLTFQQYSKILEEAGFVNIKVEDRSKQLINFMEHENAQIKADKEEFINDFSEADYYSSVSESADLLNFLEIGEQIHAVFYAEKSF